MFAIALGAVSSGVDVVGGVEAFVLTVVVSTILGVAIGWLGSRVIAMVDDHLIELTVSLAVAYGTYLLADRIHSPASSRRSWPGSSWGTTGARSA